MSRKLSNCEVLDAALEGVLTPVVLHRAADRPRIALIDQVASVAPELLVRQRAHIRAGEEDVIARFADRREVRHLAVVLEEARLEERVAGDAGVVARVTVAALLARAIAFIEDVAFAPAGNVRRVVQEREADDVVLCRPPRALRETLVLLVGDRAQVLVRVERRHIIVALHVAVAAEEPCLVADRRTANRERRVLRRELFSGAVLVLGDEAAVLEEVVPRAGEGVAARLGDDVRDEAGRPGVLGGDAAGDHLLLLDDLGVQVRPERAGDRVGHVDPVEVVQVVGGNPEFTTDVAVVEARARRGIATERRVVGQDARHQLQIALIRAARRQRLGELQRDVRIGRRARHVHHRGRLAPDRHLLGDARDRQPDANRGHLAGAYELVLQHLGLEARQLDLDRIERGRRQQVDGRQAIGVRHGRALGDGVRRARRHGHSGQEPAILIRDNDDDGPRRCHLRERG